MCFFFVRLVILWIHSTVSSFIIGDTQMPRAAGLFAVGYDMSTNTTLLLGGYDTQQQFIKFKQHNFIDVGDIYLSTDQQSYSYSQHYTQLGNILWILDKDGDYLMQFNTETYAVESNIPVQSGGFVGKCLTSTANHLIVIDYESVNIYSINKSGWLSNVPSMQKERRRISCAAVNTKIYAIGGYEPAMFFGVSDVFDSIEILDITDIDLTSSTADEWTYFSGTLSTPRAGTRCVVYGNDIFVIGGHDTDITYSDINIINVISGECTQGDTLAFTASYTAPIIVDNTLYVFGGNQWTSGDSGEFESRYQYTILPTLTPKPTFPSTTSIAIWSSEASTTIWESGASTIASQTIKTATLTVYNVTLELEINPSISGTMNGMIGTESKMAFTVVLMIILIAMIAVMLVAALVFAPIVFCYWRNSKLKKKQQVELQRVQSAAGSVSDSDMNKNNVSQGNVATHDAMKQDPIALGIVSTARERPGYEHSVSSTGSFTLSLSQEGGYTGTNNGTNEVIRKETKSTMVDKGNLVVVTVQGGHSL